MGCGVLGRPSGTLAAEWQKQFDILPRPTGVAYLWSGDMENQSEGFGSMGIALLAAIVLVYLIMVGLYDSFIQIRRTNREMTGRQGSWFLKSVHVGD